MNSEKTIYLETQDGSFPALGFGTWQLKDEAAKNAVCLALETGYRHIDTARMYENETEVGRGIVESGVPREEIWLTSKIFNDSLDAESVKRETERSLTELATDYLDLLLIHWPAKEVPLAETLSAMGELRAAGKTRHIGVSNFPVSLLREAIDKAEFPITCNQVEYHPYLAQKKLLEFCRLQKVPLVAYCPLAKGSVPKDKVLQEIGEIHGKNAVQVAIRWFLQQDGVGALPRSSNPRHIRSNFDVFDFELSEDEMLRIHGLDEEQRIINPPWAPAWD